MFGKVTLQVVVFVLLFVSCNKNTETNTETDNEIVTETGTETIQSNEVEELATVGLDEEETNKITLVSEDGRVKLEAANTVSLSGRAWSYSKLSFINSKGKKSEESLGENTYAYKLHSIKKTDGSTYYIYKWKCEGTEGLSACRIVKDTFQTVSAIDGKTQMKEGRNDFELNYDYGDWYDKTSGFGYDWILDYDNKKQNLYVPVITDDLLVTDKYEVWHFNGKKFVNKGVQPHKDLHKSLASYNNLVLYLTTKDYIVRVDSLSNKKLRYASWKRPKTMSDRPDIIIMGSKRQIYEEDVVYRFVNSKFEYNVSTAVLSIKNNGNTVLEQQKLRKK